MRPRGWSPVAAFCLAAACTGIPPDSARGPAGRALRIAACQIHVTGDRVEAMAAIDGALATAAARGAELACFPETCLLGWVNPAAHELADPIPGPTTDRLGEPADREPEVRVFEIVLGGPEEESSGPEPSLTR